MKLKGRTELKNPWIDFERNKFRYRLLSAKEVDVIRQQILDSMPKTKIYDGDGKVEKEEFDPEAEKNFNEDFLYAVFVNCLEDLTDFDFAHTFNPKKITWNDIQEIKKEFVEDMCWDDIQKAADLSTAIMTRPASLFKEQPFLSEGEKDGSSKNSPESKESLGTPNTITA